MSTPNQDQDQGGDPGYGHCLRCGVKVQLVGVESFRVGGSSGGWKMIFGELAELGEGMIDFEIFACPACRKVELRAPVI
jgi:hypothetical protein